MGKKIVVGNVELLNDEILYFRINENYKVLEIGLTPKIALKAKLVKDEIANAVADVPVVIFNGDVESLIGDKIIDVKAEINFNGDALAEVLTLELAEEVHVVQAAPIV